jgi:hypothetical protein
MDWTGEKKGYDFYRTLSISPACVRFFATGRKITTYKRLKRERDSNQDERMGLADQKRTTESVCEHCQR